MSWLDDLSLRDLDDSQIIELTCLTCGYTWLQSPVQLLLKVDHRDITLAEVARDLACKRNRRHYGVRLSLLRNDESSGFVGGMP